MCSQVYILSKPSKSCECHLFEYIQDPPVEWWFGEWKFDSQVTRLFPVLYHKYYYYYNTNSGGGKL